MHRSFRGAAILAALALLAALPAFAGELCPVSTPLPALLSVHSDGACSAWIETNYYNNINHTTLIGQCTITCRQWDMGNVDPTFGGGGKCSGSPSDFGVDEFFLCPCPP
ncbi:MAG TPA: hypothetical protein VMW75_28145 [Thermoanaerobaculia bacterium]|nr:hypothetical protein [Thermoanaerobaculia bacterium]